jgi:hypothetical protein
MLENVTGQKSRNYNFDFNDRTFLFQFKENLILYSNKE